MVRHSPPGTSVFLHCRVTNSAGIFSSYKLAKKSFASVICAIRGISHSPLDLYEMIFSSMSLCYTVLLLIQLWQDMEICLRLINISKSFIHVLWLSSGLCLSQMEHICRISHRSLSSFTGLMESLLLKWFRRCVTRAEPLAHNDHSSHLFFDLKFLY